MSDPSGPWVRCVAIGCWDRATWHTETVWLCEAHRLVMVDALREETIPHPGSLVYYVAWKNREEIKIGTTQNLKQRMASSQFGSAHVLVTEPGSYYMERKRHLQFKSISIGNELFRWTPVLAEHVEQLRQVPHWTQFKRLHTSYR